MDIPNIASLVPELFSKLYCDEYLSSLVLILLWIILMNVLATWLFNLIFLWYSHFLRNFNKLRESDKGGLQPFFWHSSCCIYDIKNVCQYFQGIGTKMFEVFCCRHVFSGSSATFCLINCLINFRWYYVSSATISEHFCGRISLKNWQYISPIFLFASLGWFVVYRAYRLTAVDFIPRSLSF